MSCGGLCRRQQLRQLKDNRCTVEAFCDRSLRNLIEKHSPKPEKEAAAALLSVPSRHSQSESGLRPNCTGSDWRSPSISISHTPGHMQLYTRAASSCAFRVRIGLNLIGLNQCELIPVTAADQGTESYRSLNPQGLVPLLVHKGNGIAQSIAILEYLEEVSGSTGAPLLPGDPPGRARVRAIAQYIVSEIQPFQKNSINGYLAELVSADFHSICLPHQHSHHVAAVVTWQGVHTTQGVEAKPWKVHWVQKGLAR